MRLSLEFQMQGGGLYPSGGEVDLMIITDSNAEIANSRPRTAGLCGKD